MNKRKHTILIADDDDDMRLLLKTILMKDGLEVLEAENGLQCVELYRQMNPDIVLLDGLMPEMDGFEACAIIKTQPGSQYTPVLMITGLNDNMSVDEAFKSGATDYITKPVNKAVLNQRVRRLLRQRDAEEVLRLRERAIEATSNSIVITEFLANTHLISYVNAAFEQLTGYSSEEVLGQEWGFLDGDATDTAAAHRINEAIASGQQLQTVQRLYRKDGSSFWNELSISPVIDPMGRVSNYVWIMTDVSSRIQFETELKSERDFNNAVLENAASLLLVIDPQGRILEFNRACENLTGYSSEEVNNRIFWEFLIPPNDLEGVKATFNDLKAGNFPNTFENYWLAKNGKPRLIAFYNNAIRDEKDRDKIKVIVSSGVDITDQKLAEENLHKANNTLKNRLDELNQRNREIKVLSEMGSLFQACRKPDEAYRVVMQHAPELFPGTSGTLSIINNSQTIVEPVASWSNVADGTVDDIFKPEDCWALRRGNLHLITDTSQGLVCSHVVPDDHFKGYLCVPLMAQGEALGVLTIYLPGEDTPNIPETVRELTSTVSEQISMALANLSLQETLYQQSISDALTGLFNRRYMQETLSREIRRAQRNNRTLGLIMCDIDHFKQFNDNYGHDAGDMILKEVSKLLRLNLRAEDLVCRFGGEEFAIIIPEIFQQDLIDRAETLRELIKRLRVQHRNQWLGTITISLGLAIYRGKPDEEPPDYNYLLEDLVKTADNALLEAKRSGRDRVLMAERDEFPGYNSHH